MSKGFGKSKKSTKLEKVNKLTLKELKSKSDNAYKTLDREKDKLKEQDKNCKSAEQKLTYHIGIITRGIEVMNRETRQLAEALISRFEADPLIAAAGQS